MVARRQPPPPAQSGGSVNFGEDTFYSGGLGLPEGDYALGFHTQMFQPTKQNGQPVGQPFLCVMLTAYPIDTNGALIGEVTEHPLGVGQKAALSFVPSADGKGFDAVPGGPATGMNDMTNWSIFRKSMRDCGLPDGVLANDFSVIDGIWVHTRNVPEPEERKQLRSQTGEAALRAASGQAEDNRVKLIPTVVEIKANGKPWEGTGGIPGEVADPAAPAARGRVAPAAAAAPGSRRIAPVAQAQAPAGNGHATDITQEDLMNVALQGLTDFLVIPANANGVTKIALRAGAFTHISKKEGDEMAQAVTETFFADDAVLNTVINQLGYKVFGPRVIVMPQA